ncbi:hypothetical protein TYRP_014238 [Tyrophagus putrescentiae]|nr:hypothetical protein TYRP_014238 [Tyrophagus putrescentiae]
MGVSRQYLTMKADSQLEASETATGASSTYTLNLIVCLESNSKKLLPETPFVSIIKMATFVNWALATSSHQQALHQQQQH